jgi:hypothetical protein
MFVVTEADAVAIWLTVIVVPRQLAPGCPIAHEPDVEITVAQQSECPFYPKVKPVAVISKSASAGKRQEDDLGCTMLCVEHRHAQRRLDVAFKTSCAKEPQCRAEANALLLSLRASSSDYMAGRRREREHPGTQQVGACAGSVGAA